MNEPRNNVEKAKWLESQIDLRIKLATEKLNGKRPDVDIPLTLNKNRLWEDVELGLQVIGSKGSFTTTHKEHGKKIKKLNELLIKLKAPTKKKYTPLEQRYNKLKEKNENLEAALLKTANQFVAYDSEMREMKDQYQLLLTGEQGWLSEKEEMLEEIDNLKKANNLLRKELIQKSNPKSGKITTVDFGGDKK